MASRLLPTHCIFAFMLFLQGNCYFLQLCQKFSGHLKLVPAGLLTFCFREYVLYAGKESKAFKEPFCWVPWPPLWPRWKLFLWAPDPVRSPYWLDEVVLSIRLLPVGDEISWLSSRYLQVLPTGWKIQFRRSPTELKFVATKNNHIQNKRLTVITGHILPHAI